MKPWYYLVVLVKGPDRKSYPVFLPRPPIRASSPTSVETCCRSPTRRSHASIAAAGSPNDRLPNGKPRRVREQTPQGAGTNPERHHFVSTLSCRVAEVPQPTKGDPMWFFGCRRRRGIGQLLESLHRKVDVVMGDLTALNTAVDALQAGQAAAAEDRSRGAVVRRLVDQLGAPQTRSRQRRAGGNP